MGKNEGARDVLRSIERTGNSVFKIIMSRTLSKEEHHKRNESICSWLGEHYHISRHLVAVEAKFSKPDLIYDAIAGRALIPQKNLKAVEDILKMYGYTPVK